MLVEALALGLVAVLATLLIHTTLALGLAHLVVPRLRSPRARELSWRLALVLGLATAGIALVARYEPLGGSWTLAEPPAEARVRARAAPEAAPAMATPIPFAMPGFPPTILLTDALSALPWAREAWTPEEISSLPRHGAEAPAADVAAFGAPRATPALWPAGTLGSAEPLTERGGTSRFERASRVEPDRASRSLLGVIAPWIALAWLAGALFALGRLALRHRALARRLASRRRLSEGPVLERLQRLSREAGLRRAPRLAATDRLSAPIGRGILRAEVCVPERALIELAPEELDALLAHELAHLERRDPLWLVAWGVAEALLFFQPLVRSARVAWQEDIEPACDDEAARFTGDRVALATCLAEVASWIVHEHRAPPASLPAPSMAAGGERLFARVHRLLDHEARPAPARPLRIATSALALAGGLALFAPRISAEPAREVAESEPLAPELAEPPDEPREEPAFAGGELAQDEPGPPCDEPTPDGGEPADEDGLGGLLDLLQTEIESLQTELGALEREAIGLRPELAVRLDRARSHLAGLRGRRERLTELVLGLEALIPETTTDPDPSTTR